MCILPSVCRINVFPLGNIIQSVIACSPGQICCVSVFVVVLFCFFGSWVIFVPVNVVQKEGPSLNMDSDVFNYLNVSML